MGELLKQFDAQGKRTDQPDIGAGTNLSQKEVSAAAGISKRQAVTAVRVANVPVDQFEAAIEQPKPATVTQLAEMATRFAWVFLSEKSSAEIEAIGCNEQPHEKAGSAEHSTGLERCRIDVFC